MDLRIIESNFIFSIYKDIELYYDLDINITTDFFEMEESKLYYAIAENMINQGYKVIDEISIENYLTGKPSTKDLYYEYGGFSTVKDIRNIVDLDNFSKYKDELLKNNILKKLRNLGFDVSNPKFKDMNTNDLYNYYEYLINDVFVDTETDIKISDFNITDDYLIETDKGNGIGASIANVAPRLNSDMGGVRNKNVIIIGGKTNAGKTSFVFGCFILPFIKQGIKTCIISNEQGLDDFRAIMLTSVLFTEFKYYKITRKKIMAGNFTDEDWKYLKKAQEFINTNYTPHLKFVKMFEYSVSKTQKIIKKLAREGFTKFVYDVFKSEDASDKNSSGVMVELSKTFFNLADKLNINVTITQQIALYNNDVRYLTEAHLSGSKQVSEVCSQVITLREVFDDEYTDEKFDIRPFNYMRDKNGEYMKDDDNNGIKEIVELSPDDRNLVVTLSKNRFGRNNVSYVFKHIGNFNIFMEMAYCNVSHVNRN